MIVAALLAGIVALNVAVLRLNMQVEQLENQRDELVSKRENIQSQLSSTAAAGRIEDIATKTLHLGAPASTTYLELKHRGPLDDDRAGREPAHSPSHRSLRGRLRRCACFAPAGCRPCVRRRSATSRRTSTARRSRCPPHRGTIYDRLGVELAVGSRATTVYANPRQIRDPRAAAVAVEQSLGLDADKVYPLLADRSRGFVYVERQADPGLAQSLQDKHIQGFGFYDEERRDYPQKRIGASVLGYAGVDNKGLAGLELELDKTLTGTRGEKTIVKDPFGRTLRGRRLEAGKRRQERLPDAGPLASRARSSACSKRRGRGGRPSPRARSSWIRARAASWRSRTTPVTTRTSSPTSPQDRQRNRAVTDTYEPGSTFKIVTISGALETGLVTPATKFTLPYEIQVADRKIHDAEPRGTQTMTTDQILSRSSNVGVVTIAEALGQTRVNDWIHRFGFGRPTGIDFPGESKGIVLAARGMVGLDDRQRPDRPGHRGDAGADDRGLRRDCEQGRPHRAASRRPGRERRAGGAGAAAGRLHARPLIEVRHMLREVVEEGSGTAAQIPGYRIAGKTGTAAKPDGAGGYSTSAYVASFVGFVPAKQPRLVILVTVDEPRGRHLGRGRGGAGIRRDRQVRPAIPRDSARLAGAAAGLPPLRS